MADIRPFEGVRYDLDRVGGFREVLGPADDIPSAEEASALIACHPFHSVRLEMIDPATPENLCRSAAYLRRWLCQGVLRRDTGPSFYVYEHEYTWEGARRKRRGFFAIARLDEESEQQMLPHENVRAEVVDIRVALLHRIQANLSPIYTLINDGGEVASLLDALVRQPADEVDGDGEDGVHRLWQVSGAESIASLQQAVASHPLYIADGHHRYAAARAYRDELRKKGVDRPEAEWVLIYISPVQDPGIIVQPIHRLFRSFAGRGWDEARHRMTRYFDVEEHDARGADGQAELLAEIGRLSEQDDLPAYVALDPGGEHYARLRLRDWHLVSSMLPRGVSDVTRHLDINLLERALLRHALGFQTADLEARIDYTADAVWAVGRVRSGAARAAIFTRPTPLEKLMAVARAGDRMPYKSTYFYPKIPIGLVLHDLTNGNGAR